MYSKFQAFGLLLKTLSKFKLDHWLKSFNTVKTCTNPGEDGEKGECDGSLHIVAAVAGAVASLVCAPPRVRHVAEAHKHQECP